MTNWTRMHDAWIARECEGLAVEYRISGVGQSGPVDWCFLSPMPFIPHGGEPEDVWVPVKHYLTDPAAAIRAAEAWVAQKPKKRKWWLRRDRVVSAMVDHGMYSDTVVGGTPAAALAQALLRATGGPA